MFRTNQHPQPAPAVAGNPETPYTPERDGHEAEVSAMGAGSPGAAHKPTGGEPPSGNAARRERSGEALTRAEKMLVTMLAALIGCAALGFFSMNASMNANFLAINGHLLDVQEQMGDLRSEIGDLRTELSNRITRFETIMEIQFPEAAKTSADGDAAGSPRASGPVRR